MLDERKHVFFMSGVDPLFIVISIPFPDAQCMVYLDTYIWPKFMVNVL